MNREAEKRTGNRKKSRKEQKGEQDREQKRTKQNKKVYHFPETWLSGLLANC